MSILEVRNLTKEFGGFRAVSRLSFTVEAGVIVGLVGPNGAGKTTTFNVISGFSTPTTGQVFFGGEDITGWAPHALARRGIVRTFQNTRVFTHLTVEDNIATACYKFTPGGVRRTLWGLRRDEEASLRTRVDEILVFTGLSDKRFRIAEELPYGDQRILGIAIALGAGPGLLLLDEPFAGMNPGEADRCMALIHTIRRAGVTVLLIDHHMTTLMRNCDRLVVMHHGEKLAEGTPEEIRRNTRVIEIYLGQDAHA